MNFIPSCPLSQLFEKSITFLYLWVDQYVFSCYIKKGRRGVAQLVEHRSPKPRAAGSSPVSPAIFYLNTNRSTL